jgi:hypothetical protein
MNNLLVSGKKLSGKAFKPGGQRDVPVFERTIIF